MNKRHYEHTLPNIRGSLSNTYVPVTLVLIKCGIQNRAVRGDSPVLQGITVVYMQHLFHFPILYAGGIRIPGS